MIWHSAGIDDIINSLSTNLQNGLSNGEADNRLSEYGKNSVAELEKPTYLKRLCDQLKNKTALILIAIAILTFIIGLIYGEKNAYASLLLIVIVVINSLVSAFHLYSSDHARSRLKGLTNPLVTVIRDGITKQIPSDQLVPGDIMLLKEGDYITADARLIESTEFRCNESSITGDVIPVEKHYDYILEDITPVEERNNMVFSGCTVVHGTAKTVVVATGLSTETGHNSIISHQIGDDALPLQSLLDKTGNILNIVIICFCALFFAFAMLRNFRDAEFFASFTLNTLMNSIALAVAAIPECLPAISTIVISLGIERIVKDNIIIKKAGAVELLGHTSVVCADKTGILTHNNMILSRIYDGENMLNLEDKNPTDKASLIIKLAAICSTLSNDATENAIFKACLSYNSLSRVDIENMYPCLNKIPFDPERKTMTTINMIDGKTFAIVKGAAEILIEKCVNCDKEAILKQNDAMAQDAMRMICIAMKPLDEIPANPNPEDIENNLIFVGLLGIYDPPRNGAISAIADCEAAGIHTIMITGDHPITARAVARRIGILKDGTELITGSELDELSDDELNENIEKYSVFARISPADKVRIIKAWQKKNEIVTITGDSAVDADALTLSDIGCAVGKHGTDIARGCADIVITDNSFQSVVSAIKESRGLFENIRKSIIYLFSCNFAELLLFLIGILFTKNAIAPLTAVQLLLVNLLTDSAPGISLSFEKAENHVMRRKPHGLSGHIFDSSTIISISLEAVFIAAMSLIAFFIGQASSDAVAVTMCFATLSIIQIFHLFNIKTSRSVFSSVKTLFTSNKVMSISAATVFVIILLLTLTPIGSLFGLKMLSFGKFLISLILAICIVPFCEIKKIIMKS